MHVCLVTREFPPVTTYTGGIGRAFAGLARGLANAGHRVTVLVPGLEHATSADGAALVVGLGSSRLRAGTAAAGIADALTVRRELQLRADIDVVFSPEWHGDDALARRGAQTPVHVTNLTTGLRQIRALTEDSRWIGEMRPHRVVQRMLERRQTELADGIVAGSQPILDWTSSLWKIDGKSVAVIANGVDADWAQRLAAGPLPDRFPRVGPTVVFAGRLESLKGVTYLAEAMLEVWRSHPAASLVLIGRDGAWKGMPMSEHVRRVVGDRADRLVYLGEQPPERLFPALAAADVAAFPSLWESQGLVALEALVVGTPVVATKGTGLQGFVRDGENGLLVEPARAADLSAALVRLLSDRQLCQRLAAAAPKVAETFSLEATAQRHADFFAELLGRHGRLRS